MRGVTMARNTRLLLAVAEDLRDSVDIRLVDYPGVTRSEYIRIAIREKLQRDDTFFREKQKSEMELIKMRSEVAKEERINGIALENTAKLRGINRVPSYGDLSDL